MRWGVSFLVRLFSALNEYIHMGGRYTAHRRRMRSGTQQAWHMYILLFILYVCLYICLPKMYEVLEGRKFVQFIYSIQCPAHRQHSINAYVTDISAYMVPMNDMKIGLGSFSEVRMPSNWQQDSKITFFFFL